MPLAKPTKPASPLRPRIGWRLASVLGALMAGIALLLASFYRIGLEDAKDRAWGQLEAVAEGKSQGLAAWIAEILSDAAILQDSALIAGPIEATLRGKAGPEELAETNETLLRYARTRQLKTLQLLNKNGRVMLRTRDVGPLSERILRLLPNIALGAHPVRMTLDIDDDREASVIIITPISDGNSEHIGFVYEQVRLRPAAQRIVSRWPVQSASSESILLFGRADHPLALTPRRFVSADKALAIAVPTLDLASQKALSSAQPGRFESIDYRGQPVLAFAQRVPETSWVILTKTDYTEAVAGVHQQLWILGLGSVVLLVLGSLATIRLSTIQAEKDRARLNEALAEQARHVELENRLREAQLFGRFGSWERHIDRDELWWSSGMFALMGEDRPEAVTSLSKFVAYIHPDDRPIFDAATANNLPAGERGSTEFRLLRVDGRIIHVQHQWQTLYDENGQPTIRRGITQDVTDRVQAEAAQRAQLDRLSTLIENMPGAVTFFDGDLKLRFFNRQFQTLLDLPDDLFAKPELTFEQLARYNAWRGEYGPGDPEQQVKELVARAKEAKPHQFERKRPDGSYIEVRGAPLHGGGFVSIYTDISERKKAEERQLLADKIFDTSPTAILISNARNEIIYVNPAFTQITGFTQREVRGKNPKVLSSGRHDPAFFAKMWDDLAQTDSWSGEIWDRRRDGSVYPKWLSIHVLRNLQNRLTHYVAMFTDITERKQAEQRIHHLAHHDPLTGLANRGALEARLGQALADARRHQGKVALLFIDLDRFKNINDSLGHHMGDLLLIEIARRLSQRLRETDIVARLGGDEFVVALPDLADLSRAAAVADELLHDIARPIDADGTELHTSGSIGIAIFPNDGEDVASLMRSADTAMYEAKSAGRNVLRFFTGEMTATANERLRLENDLRQALGRQQLVVHYQPQVSPADGRIRGVEALVRWQHPKDGFIGPDRFIPIAEDTGLIVELGRWVLETACAQAAHWNTQGLPVRLSVNLSAKQLRDPALAHTISSALETSGLPARQLELEITESALMERPKDAVALLERICALGCSLALDDFGTGYSSLAYLKLFPIDRLKIDRSFVRDLTTDANDRAIALSTLALAHSLDLEVTAEGVETAEQRDFLVDNGCEEVQGWYYAKALSSEQVTPLLQRGTLP